MLTSCLPSPTLIIMLNASGSSRSAIRTRKLFIVQRTICMCFSVLKTSLLICRFAERLTTHKLLKFLCQVLNLNLEKDLVSPVKMQRDLGRESYLLEIVNKNLSEVRVESLHLPKRKSKLTLENPSKVEFESEAVNLMIRIKIKRTSLSISSRLSRLIKLSKLMNN